MKTEQDYLDMVRSLATIHKPLDDMNPEEKIDYIDEINYLFVDYIKVAPFVEIGEVDEDNLRRLRSHVYEGKYSVGEIIFELQRNLWTYQQRNPEHKWKMVVGLIELTPDIRSEHFCPLPGIMVRMKFEKR